MKHTIFLFMLMLLPFSITQPSFGKEPVPTPVALTHGTLIDVRDGGHSQQDIFDATIVIQGDRILDAGPGSEVVIPPGAEIIDCTGQFLVPGLIDGFAALNHQGQANAYLACGVTSILGVESTRRGPLDLRADPSPHIYRLGEAGYEPASTDSLLAVVRQQKRLGMDAVLLMYRIEPEQMGPVINLVHELGMAGIGELALTTYAEAARLGMNAFVHSSRYSLDLTSEELRQGVADIPFSNDLNSAKWQYYRQLSTLAQDTAKVRAQGRIFAKSGVALLPTFSLGYLDRPGHANPWDDPVATIIDPRDINLPADRITGRHHLDDPLAALAYTNLAAAELALDTQYAAEGTRYLAGSGSDVWGTMPGISLHQELSTLGEIGLTPRQVLAAATSNFSTVMGWQDVGLLAPGRRADILVLGSDPRQEITALRDIHLEFLAGHPIDLASLMRPVTLPDGQLLAREDFTIPDDVLDENGDIPADYPWLHEVTINKIMYSSDGLRVAGHLITPNTPGPHPCLIYNRGGNREFGANSPRRVALRLARFAAWGYVVVASQYRGNGGGEGLEEFGGREIDDVLNLIPLLAALPAEADTSRIGMIGFSRGGMETYLALARTNRIKGAAVAGGVSDAFATIEDRPDMETYVYAELAPDYESHKQERLTERSAVMWPQKMCATTPLLLMHGSSDWRVGVNQSIHLAQALIKIQHPVRLVVFEGAEHGLSEYRSEAYGMIRRWLDRYVRDGATWPDLNPHGD